MSNPIVALPVVSDTPSQVVGEVHRSVNNLMFVLANIAAQVTATTITATEGWVALSLTLAAGVDGTVASINGGANTYTGTGLQLVAVQTLPKLPREPKRNTRVVNPGDA